jgi:hypothetical protein
MKHQMTTQEIVRTACKKENIPFEKVYVNLHQAVANNQARIIRYGNTLFTSKIIKPKVSEVHLFTADNPFELAKAIKEFMSAMKVGGFVKLVTDLSDGSLIPLLKRANVRFTSTPSQSGYHLEIEV